VLLAVDKRIASSKEGFESSFLSKKDMITGLFAICWHCRLRDFSNLCLKFMMNSVTLSQGDSKVLSALFDPESSLNSIAQVDSNISDSATRNKNKLLQERERLALRLVNQEQPQQQDIEQAIFLLTSIIDSDPGYASAWNNRAQMRRMLIVDEKLSQNPSAVADILEDLAHAVTLATPHKTNGAVSSTDANVLASAHTHRGYLLLISSKSEANRQMLTEVPNLQNLSTQDLEEAASRELALGGRYGNGTARQLAVKTNPYAKLCGSIVREALTKEISDFYQPWVNVER
jgi:hypothetical protein